MAFLLLRALTPRPASRKSLLVADVALALVCSIGVATVGSFWLARFHLAGGSLTGADFQQYCGSVAWLRGDGTEHWYFMRSTTSGLLPALLARKLGVLDGLAWASLLSLSITVLAVYTWARVLMDRLAAVAAAMLVASVAPLVLSSRFLSFYPEIMAGLTLAAAASALAVRVGGRWGALLAGCSSALAFLVDGRGLAWGLAYLVLALSLVFFGNGGSAGGKKTGEKWIRLSLVLLPIVVSWFAGGPANQRTWTLESQVALMIRTNSPDPGASWAPEPGRWAGKDGYRWGHGNPLNIPATVVDLAIMTAQSSSHLSEGQSSVTRSQQVWPWTWPGVVGLALVLWGLRRKPMLLSTWLVTIAPFSLYTWQAARMEPSLRFLALAFPVIPLTLGMGISVLLKGEPLKRPGSHREKDRTEQPAPAPQHASAAPISLRGGLALLLLLLMIQGVIPGFLSPAAPWRVPFVAVNEGLEAVMAVRDGTGNFKSPPVGACLAALQKDLDSGIPARSRVYAHTERTESAR